MCNTVVWEIEVRCRQGQATSSNRSDRVKTSAAYMTKTLHL